ncbi:hypothetical protein GGF43_006082, partial [Coemansia sp. RSA 2618]
MGGRSEPSKAEPWAGRMAGVFCSEGSVGSGWTQRGECWADSGGRARDACGGCMWWRMDDTSLKKGWELKLGTCVRTAPVELRTGRRGRRLGELGIDCAGGRGALTIAPIGGSGVCVPLDEPLASIGCGLCGVDMGGGGFSVAGGARVWRFSGRARAAFP